MALITTQEAVKLWKELGITECEMEFSCGGDSMNDYTFTFFKGSEKIESPELDTFFEDEVYKHVEFYVNSDGHYMGESGKVHIELDEEDDELLFQNHPFTYSKSAQSEFSERFTSVGEMKLTKKELEFLQKNVSNINGGDGDFNMNFKRDFILTDEDETPKLTFEDNKLVLRISREFYVYRDSDD